jgi:hypothetical protein
MKMKQFLLSLTGLVLFFTMQAQSYETIKNEIILQQLKKAKEDLDKGMTNAKFTSKPEAYIQKTTIYAGLAVDPATKGTTAGDQLLADAEVAFNKYKEMDPSMALLSDPVYQNGPINIYSGYFSSGYKDYEAKNWKSGFDKFKKVVEFSDLLIARKIISVPADTNSLLLAGLTAESGGLKDEAAIYYTRMADLKAKGSGFEGIYRFLVNYYYTKKDMANFEKYRALGKELYPNNEYFTYDKVDFAVGLEEDFNKKLKALEETVAADPTNQKATILIGEIIYDTLDSRKDGAVQPSNAAELETKMIAAFNKSAQLKPGDETPYIYIADHFINKSIKVSEARDKHVADMKARTKPGTASSKEDVAKRDALDKEYANAFTSAREPYEKAADILSKKPTPLSGVDKQQYKKVAGYLADIATYNKNKAKGDPANLAKFTADEKKWNDVYDSIK